MPAAREPQDRKPARKRAAPQRVTQRRSTPAEVAATDAVDETVGPRAEVVVEDTGFVEVPFSGRVFRVRPAEEWRQSTNDALSEGRANDWAADVMPRDDYEAWLDLDPTNREFGDFMEEMGRQVGMSVGESAASNRALRRMRRR